MKKLAAILCLSALTTGAFAQGLVNFLNNNSTLTSATISGNTSATSGAVGSWYYGILIGASTTSTANFTFTGVYATNLATAGRFFGGTSVPVPGWGAGVTTNYSVAIWSASLGPIFKTSWLTGSGFTGTAPLNFGTSPIATAASGGAGSPASPAFNLFGGTSGIQTGFNAGSVGGVVPEPSSMALAGLGAAALLIFRRRK